MKAIHIDDGPPKDAEYPVLRFINNSTQQQNPKWKWLLESSQVFSPQSVCHVADDTSVCLSYVEHNLTVVGIFAAPVASNLQQCNWKQFILETRSAIPLKASQEWTGQTDRSVDREPKNLWPWLMLGHIWWKEKVLGKTKQELHLNSRY